MSYPNGAPLTAGSLNTPAPNQAKTLALLEHLIEQDRELYHCLWGELGFHNHLSHHLFAAYDMGASAETLQRIYDRDIKQLKPINVVEDGEKLETIDNRNWSDHLGDRKYYASYLAFFKHEISIRGARDTLHEYLFSTAAVSEPACMHARIVSGAFHPLIIVGYAVEFGCTPAVLAQGLAQAAIHRPLGPIQKFPIPISAKTFPQSITIFEVISRAAEDPSMSPVMPYEPENFLSKHSAAAAVGGERQAAVAKLAHQWISHSDDLPGKADELTVLAVLLLAATSKPGRKPRLDFFLMHILNASHFLRPLLSVLSVEDGRALLAIFLAETLWIMILRGRPKVDAQVLMTYSEFPPMNANDVNPNPWFGLIQASLKHGDAHVLKAIRTLYCAAQRLGTKESFAGAECIRGGTSLDGSVFLRTAGLIMDYMGWGTPGEWEGVWDRSGLGWEEAWSGKDD